MPSYTSAFNGHEAEGQPLFMSCGVYPVCFSAKSGAAGAGCAPRIAPEDVPEQATAKDFRDILDEVLYYFKARMMLKTFPMEGPADRLSLYLTLYLQQCIRRVSKQEAPFSATQCRNLLQMMAMERPIAPGDHGYPFNAVYSRGPDDDKNSDAFHDYLKQLRLELSYRLTERLYAFPEADGGPNKFWMTFARKDLLGHMFEK